MAYYTIDRGKNYIIDDVSKFETDSGMIIKADSVADLLIQLATKHPAFLMDYDGLLWNEITKSEADIMLGIDVDEVLGVFEENSNKLN
ncbi:hypothetical protein HMPREF1210_00139 [Paenisporosarcina sp. HGH0030]|nr:hypothetical protein HMPREF1210_00139 [Paenisporosarcina sp. HGH0030]